MHLDVLNIHDFRNIRQLNLALHPRFNLISGQNGSGKTAILEAIYFLSLGRSFRSAHLTRIIQYQQPGFQLFAKFQDHQEYTLASMRENSGKSVIKLNAEIQSSQAALTRVFPVQLFHPESFSLISSGAQQRCKLLDWGAFYHHKTFLKVWQEAKRLIKQRNAGLKRQFPHSYIVLLEQKLAEKAEILHLQRRAYFNKLQPQVLKILAEFSEKIPVDISYFKGWSSDKPLAEILAMHYPMDMKTGTTSHGPHRADVRFKVEGHPAQDILSRGQQKLLISAIKLAQGDLFCQDHQTACIYLIDDLHSELDQIHLSYIFEKLVATGGQIIATCIRQAHMQQLFQPYDYQCHQVSDGKLS